MTQQEMELPTHCYCGIYNVIRTSMTKKNSAGNGKNSYQMKMKAWLVDAIVSWILLIVLGIRSYLYKFQQLIGLSLGLQPFETKPKKSPPLQS
ncbi:hypothetical protein M9H77_22833 [Catharanthus roseus]|uniref:Uncharacterized protein n=1 Tax=Catharanthus roseus TaxID=4058 RepID=A0ACC0AT36_CATRO|nr:hypothetical protein M9H77_22833 [Catharanthus roseus]